MLSTPGHAGAAARIAAAIAPTRDRAARRVLGILCRKPINGRVGFSKPRIVGVRAGLRLRLQRLRRRLARSKFS